MELFLEKSTQNPEIKSKNNSKNNPEVDPKTISEIGSRNNPLNQSNAVNQLASIVDRTGNFVDNLTNSNLDNNSINNALYYTANWFTNEKVALECALGASVSGKRALVLVKHVGMNLLSDPLITSVTHTIGAGLVIITGDDPGVKGSQNEQDSRWYGRIAEVAVYDPDGPDTAYRALRRAYELSEETKTPVLLRVTSGLEKSKGRIKRLPVSVPPHPVFDRNIWKKRMVEKHQLFHSKVYPLLEAEAENTDLNKIIVYEKEKSDEVEFYEKEFYKVEVNKAEFNAAEFEEQFDEKKSIKGKSANSAQSQIGIISSGSTSLTLENVLKKSNLFSEILNVSQVSNTCNESGISQTSKSSQITQILEISNNSRVSRISHLSLNLVNPLPIEKIKRFLRNNKRVLISEESEAFIEEQICIAGNVFGKKTGHLPYGQIAAEDIEFALKNIREDKVKEEKALKFNETSPVLSKTTSKERASICGDCPYLPLYHFLKTLEVRIAGDMGCSVRSAPEPLAAVDVSFALGSAISVACGFERKGIAVIGDFALAHSGILGLLSAANSKCNVLILVLQNEVAAMTGGQIVPDLLNVVEAIVPDVSIFDIDINQAIGVKNRENSSEIKGTENIKFELSNLIKEKLTQPGISVIFIKGKCRKY